MNHIAVTAALAASLMMGACATAQTEQGADATIVPEGFALTGETRNCLSLTSIDDIDTISADAWLVTTTARDSYLTRVGRGCRAATQPFTYISYEVTGSQLCQGEIVRVIDQGSGSMLGSCSIGEFEELSPLPDDAS